VESLAAVIGREAKAGQSAAARPAVLAAGPAPA
jgi:hypothetical protein